MHQAQAKFSKGLASLCASNFHSAKNVLPVERRVFFANFKFCFAAATCYRFTLCTFWPWINRMANVDDFRRSVRRLALRCRTARCITILTFIQKVSLTSLLVHLCPCGACRMNVFLISPQSDALVLALGTFAYGSRVRSGQPTKGLKVRFRFRPAVSIGQVIVNQLEVLKRCGTVRVLLWLRFAAENVLYPSKSAVN